MRRFAVFMIALLALLAFPLAQAAAEPESGVDAEMPESDAALSDGVERLLEDVDWAAFERVMQALPESVKDVWNGCDLKQLTRELALSGTFSGAITTDSWLSALKTVLRDEGARLAGVAATLIGLSLISGLTGALLAEKKDGVAAAAAFVCRCFTLTVVLSAFAAGAANAMECVRGVCGLMELVTPVLMTLLAAIGGTASVGLFQPSMSLLTGGVAKCMEAVVLPLVTCGGVLSLFHTLCARVRLGELGDLCRQSVKWIVGAATTLYCAVTALGGMTAAAYDGVAVRTAKYAAGSMFPMVSGLLTGSFDTVLGCAALVKNAAGVAAMLLCASIAAVPLIRLAATALMLRLTAALVQPVAQREQVAMCKAGAEMLTGLLSALAAVAAMFLVTIGLIVGVGNAGLVG